MINKPSRRSTPVHTDKSRPSSVTPKADDSLTVNQPSARKTSSPKTLPLLRVKSARASAPVYLQFVSIIQSLILGVFVTKLKLEAVFSPDFYYILQCTLVLQVIVVTWHEYVLGTIIYEWVLGLSDAWIPVALGITQYFLIEFMSTKSFAESPEVSWFTFSLSFFALVTAVAYANQYFKSDKFEGNRKVIEHLKDHRREKFYAIFGFFFLFLILAIAALSPKSSDVYYKSIGLIVLNVCLLAHQIRLTVSSSLRTLFH